MKFRYAFFWVSCAAVALGCGAPDPCMGFEPGDYRITVEEYLPEDHELAQERTYGWGYCPAVLPVGGELLVRREANDTVPPPHHECAEPWLRPLEAPVGTVGGTEGPYPMGSLYSGASAGRLLLDYEGCPSFTSLTIMTPSNAIRKSSRGYATENAPGSPKLLLAVGIWPSDEGAGLAACRAAFAPQDGVSGCESLYAIRIERVKKEK